MKKTTKKNPSRASQKKAARNLELKPAKVETVRGGYIKNGWDTKLNKKI